MCFGSCVHVGAQRIACHTAACDAAARSHNLLLAAAVWPPLADINECTAGTADCVSPATCVDKDPAVDGAKFVCTCDSSVGWVPTGTGTSCARERGAVRNFGERWLEQPCWQAPL